MSNCLEKKNIYLTNISSFYRDYNDYLYNKRCCNKLCGSVNNNNVVNLGNGRCCSNNISKYYNSYSYFLNDKNCCNKLILLNAYTKYALI
jgi:hypothetical protein